jgi:hypothetical protein
MYTASYSTFQKVLVCVQAIRSVAPRGWMFGFWENGCFQPIVNEYPLDWIKNYQNNSLVICDPLMRWATIGAPGHFTFDELLQIFPNKKFSSNLRNFGFQDGNALKFRRGNELFLFSSVGPQLSWQNIQEVQEILTLINDTLDFPLTSESLGNVVKFPNEKVTYFTDHI